MNSIFNVIYFTQSRKEAKALNVYINYWTLNSIF